MTSKEAKKILNEYRNRNYNSSNKDEVELAKAIDIVLPKYVELEARDTPMKLIENRVIDLNTHNQWGVLHCPKCSCVVVYSTYQVPPILPNYCEVCGQRLDWGNENDK